jgi:hypothetical protein
METIMKLLKLVVCVGFTLSVVGCAAEHEHIVRMSPDAAGCPAAAAQTADLAQGAGATGDTEHPIRDKCREVVRKTGAIIAAPIVLPIFFCALLCMPLHP